MKKVIRQGVFETNSSSTHSVVLLEKDLNQKWRETSEIPTDEREIRTPLNKLYMTLGLLDHQVDQYKCSHGCYHMSDEELASDTELFELEKEINLFKEVLIRKYFEKFEGDTEKIMEEIDKSKENYTYSYHCLRFFNEDVLIDCNCGLDSFWGLYKALKVDYPDKEEFEKAADYLFKPNVYYLLKEGWRGGIWYIDEAIF